MSVRDINHETNRQRINQIAYTLISNMYDMDWLFIILAW